MNSELIPELLSQHYGLKNPHYELIRSLTNYVYRVNTATERFILKIFSDTWRHYEDVQYEIALLEHLSNKGLRVANALPTKNGDKIVRLSRDSEDCYMVLFEYVAGVKPQPSFSNELYASFGKAIAQTHEFSNDFNAPVHRQPLDLEYLIERPLALTAPLLPHAADRQFVDDVAQKTKAKISHLAARGMDWGPIHGDATLDNLHITTDNQIILYDFDSGGPGWRATDLQGWAKNRPEYADKWLAFQAGYKSIRDLKAVDLEAAPYLATAFILWGFQNALGSRVSQQGPAKVQAYLAVALHDLRERASYILG